jgi:hypothetical protein
MIKENKPTNITIEELQKQIEKLNVRVENLEKDIKNNKNKKTKKKDPNAPKKNMSSFFQFAKEKREQFKKNNPGAKIYVVEINKQAKKEWDNLDELQKKKYIDIAIKDEKRYEKEIKKYNEKKEFK